MALKVFVSCKAAIKDARAAGYLATSPEAGISIKVGSRHKAKVAIPEVAEVKTLPEEADRLAASPNKWIARTWKRYQVFFHVEATTGLRPSELRGLPWSKVDLSGATVSVAQRADEDCKIGPPKTAAAYRAIHLPPHVVLMLKEWRLMSPRTRSDLDFPTQSDQPMAHNNICNKAWYPLQVRAGVTVQLTDKLGEPRTD